MLDAKDNTPISGFTGLIPDERGMISLAGLSATTYPAIKLKANLSTTLADSTPGVCQWTTTFEMEKSPSFTFKVKIDDRPEVSEINNTVDISTSTAETNYLNNSSEAQIQIIMSDVEVEKSVDKTAVFTSETLTYTLDYINN